ncbi:hypothetical protein [Aeromonas veronii]
MKKNNSDSFNKAVNLATKHTQEVTKLLMENLINQAIKNNCQEKSSPKDSINEYKGKLI